MNGLFKTGFILLLLCISCLILSIISAYILSEQILSALFAVLGCVLAFLGIIFTALSKPKEINDEVRKEPYISNVDIDNGVNLCSLNANESGEYE